MKFSVVSLFPEVITQSLHGVLSRAVDKKILSVEALNPRQFCTDAHQSVDDRPFGGGDGMIMRAEPLHQAVSKLRTPGCKVIYLSPQGKPLDLPLVQKLAGEKHLILVCGRYGGVDERWIQQDVDHEVSIGDYVLSGGELPALVLMDAVARFVPGVLGHADSARSDSFTDGLLESPQFTRPEIWSGKVVPEVLTSGHHQNIQRFRHHWAWLKTWQKRPDLAQKKSPSLQLKKELTETWRTTSEEDRMALGLQELPLTPAHSPGDLHLALVHHPMLDKDRNIVATNITNFDIHDIARACRVYGVQSYTLVHPMQEQLMFVSRILDHWRVGLGAKYNPSRKKALERVETVESLEKLRQRLQPDLVIATHARGVEGTPTFSCAELKAQIQGRRRVLLLFGTGYGFPDEILRSFDGVLESLVGAPPDDFRHLSVRSAVSIYLDRLLAP